MARPVTSLSGPFGSLSTSPHVPGLARDGQSVFVSRRPLYIRRAPATDCLCAFHVCQSTLVEIPPAPALSRTPPRATRSRVPRSQRLRRRRFAPFHTDRSTPLSCSVPLLTASHPRVGAGNVSRPLLRVGPAIPPPTPTPAHGTHCPPIRAYGASAFGAISVPPDLSGPLPSVHSPLHLSDSALSVSARCLPNRLARSRRG